MEISFTVAAAEATISSRCYRNELDVELKDVELSNLVSAINNDFAIMAEIDQTEVISFVQERIELTDVLERYGEADIAAFMVRKGWKVGAPE